MPTTVFAQALSRAAQILGGRHELCAYLRVSLRQLDAWMAGAEKPPTDIFLKAVDVISGQASPSHAQLIRQSREICDAAQQTVLKARATRETSEAVRRAALLARGADEIVRRPAISAADFAAKEFAPSESALILDNALNAAVNGTAATRANVQLVCPEGLRIVAHLGFKRPFLEFFATVGHETAACGRAHEMAQRVVVSNVRADPIFVGTPAGEVMESASALACQSTPLLGSSGEVIGMLSTHYEKPHQPSPEELATLDLVCQRASFWLAGNV